MKRSGSRKQDIITILSMEMSKNFPLMKVKAQADIWRGMSTDQLETILKGV